MLSPKKEVVHDNNVPPAIGPYSMAIRLGGMVYTSGQLGIQKETGELAPGGIEAETRQALTNLRSILESAGSSMGHVVKTTIFLRDMNDFPRVNAIYGEYFPEPFPARSTVQVAALPKGGAVEVEAVAVLATQPGE